LSHAQPGFEDLRLVRDGKQLPYILERTSINRLLPASVTAVNDAKDPRLSRWAIKLPRSALPVIRLQCRARTALFERNVALWEEVTDERGQKSRRTLGGAAWVQTPGRASREFRVTIDSRPESDTLF